MSHIDAVQTAALVGLAGWHFFHVLIHIFIDQPEIRRLTRERNSR